MSVHPLSIVTWNHGYPWVTLCASQSSHFCSNTLVRMCSCIITCIYVHLTPYVRFTPTTSHWRSHLQLQVQPLNGCPISILQVQPLNGCPTSKWQSKLWMEVPPESPHFCSHTLVRMFICISTCMHVHLTPNITSIPYAYLYGNIVTPVWHCVCVPSNSFVFPHLV